MRSLSVAVVLLVPSSAVAGGLFIPGTGPQAQARAGAFVAKADDPSALFHNPAGFAQQDGWVIHVGANFVDYDITFDREGVYEQPAGPDLTYDGQEYEAVSDESSPKIGLGPFQLVPLISVSGDVGVKNLRIGFGLMAPQAYPERSVSAEYEFEADENEPPPPARYDVVKQSAATVMPSVAVAYRVHPKIDVGARFTWGFANLEAVSYVWGIRNYEEWIARDGRFEVKVSDPFVPAFGIGVKARVSPVIEVGAAWSSPMTVNAKGKGSSRLGSDLGLNEDTPDEIVPENEFPQCAAGGTDQDNLKACLELGLPMTATVGGRYIIRDANGVERGDVELDASWEQWSAASDIKVIVDGKSMITGFSLNPAVIRHGFKDVFSVRFGGAWSFPVGKNRLVVRAGAAYDTAAAKKNWDRMDLDGAARATLAAGIAYQMAKLRIDLGGGAVLEPNRTVEACNPDLGTPACPGDEADVSSADHAWPNPVQPLSGELNQVQSPFNGGTYESGYILLSLGITYIL